MAKRGPAIGGLHSQGIVDDILIPVAKKVFRATKKNALNKEVKIIAKRHKVLSDARRAGAVKEVYGKNVISRKVGKAKSTSAEKKLRKNMQSGTETSNFYRKNKGDIGLPTTYAPIVPTKSRLTTMQNEKRKAAIAKIAAQKATKADRLAPPRPPARTKAQTKELEKRLAEAKAKRLAATAVPRPPRPPKKK
jgi:hypothetical protein